MKKIILLFSMVLMSTAILTAQNNANSPATVKADPNAPEIKFEKTTHDYGTIYQNGDGNCEFVFKNTGKTPLILRSVRSSCGCTVPEWPREPILPGKSQSIKVKYDTKRIGYINKQITVNSNATNGTIVLKIKGQVLNKPAETIPEKNNTGAPTAK